MGNDFHIHTSDLVLIVNKLLSIVHCLSADCFVVRVLMFSIDILCGGVKMRDLFACRECRLAIA